MLDPDYVASSSVKFEELLAAASYNLVNPPRLVNLRSQQTWDPAALPTDGTAPVVTVQMFVEDDRITGATGPFVLTEEPRLVRNNNTSSSVALLLLATYWEWNKSAYFTQSGAADVGDVEAQLGRSVARMALTNRIMEGPHNLSEALNDFGNGTRYTANAAGDAVGSDGQAEKKMVQFSTPRLIEPQTQLDLTIQIPGVDMAGAQAAAGPVEFAWCIPAIAADIKG